MSAAQELTSIRMSLDEIVGKVTEVDKEFEKLRDQVAGVGKGSKEGFGDINTQMKLLKMQSLAVDKALKTLSITVDRKTKKSQQYAKTLDSLREKKAAIQVEMLRLRQEMVRLDTTQKNASRGTREFGTSLLSLKRMANQVLGVFGTGLGFYGVVRLMRNVVGTVRDIESAQRQLQAVTGATETQMAKLSGQAISLGSATQFGSKGVLDLQTQLGKMGFSVREITNMGEAITNLATATQEDLAKTTETVANVIRAYNLDAREAARVTDVMAESFTSSALDVEKFRQSMKYIAPIANQANFSIEDTTTLLARLADAGISGSLAGTSLRNVISQLSDANSNLSKRVDMTVNGFDDFIEAIKILNEQGTDLGDVFQIMDRRAASAFAIILGNAEALNVYRDSLVNASGAAERMARIQKNSIGYQSKRAAAAWGGFIAAIDKGEGVMSQAIKGTLGGISDVLNMFTDSLAKESKALEVEITSLEMVIGMAGNANLELEKRIEYIKRLRAEYPQYFADLKTEIETSEDVTAALESVGETIEYLRKTLRDTATLAVFSESIDKADKAAEKIYQNRIRNAKNIIRLNRKIKEQEEDESGGIKVSYRGESQLTRDRRLLNQETERSIKLKGEHAKALEAVTLAHNDLNEAMWMTTVTTDAFLNRARQMPEWERSVGSIVETFRDLTNEVTELDDLEAHYRQWVADQNKVLKGLHEQLEGQKDGTAEHKEATKQIEQIGEALKEVGDIYKNMSDDITKTNKETESQLRIQMRLEELRLRRMYEGIKLEEELSKMRLFYGRRIAMLKPEGTEREQLLAIANLERQIDKQGILASRLKEQQQILQKEARMVDELMGYYQRLSAEKSKAALSELDSRDVDRRMEIELKAAQDAHGREIDAAKNKEADKIMVAETAHRQRVANMAETGESLAQLEEELGRELAHIDRNSLAERAALEAEHQNKINAIRQKGLDDYIAIQQRVYDEAMREYDFMQEMERVRFFSKRRGEHAVREFEREQHEQRLKEQEELLKAQILAVEARIKASEGNELSEAKRALEELSKLLEEVQTKLQFPDYDSSYWKQVEDAAREAANHVKDALGKMFRDKEEFARKEREMLDRQVDESLKRLELEMRNREAGYAENVDLMRKQYEENRRLRREAAIEEEKAAERTRRAEAIIQSVNLMSSAANIMKDSTKKFGALGVLVAAGTIAGMWGAWSNVKQKSKAITRYTHGGSLLLKGKSHAQGGIPIAQGHEAQGGEGMSIWNRRVTKKSWPKIRELTDAINSGRMPGGSTVNVMSDNKDIRAMRKIMENEEKVHYEGNKRITKKGNYTYICHLN